ncbi:MAG: hypothetical protein ACLP5H_23990 [Desulfomonilaceae bacterium]
MEFGIYFYPWYHKKKWDEAPVPHHPLRGLYDSRDPEILTWQMDLIQRCGFDYVVFEFVPLKDWNFGHCAMAIEKAISCLRDLNMKWAFMVDGAVIPPSDHRIYDIEAMIRYIENCEWGDALIRGKSGKPLWLSYAPLPHEAAYLQQEFDAYEWRFPVWVRHWGEPDEQFALPAFRDFGAEAQANRVSVFDSLVKRHYIAFWESADTSHNFDGFCSVMPGYSDMLLKRNPQLAPEVDRQDGVTLMKQFQSAVETEPDHILVYSWNEYFEGSNIEPTLEYDFTYAQIVRDLIDETRQHRTNCDTRGHQTNANRE